MAEDLGGDAASAVAGFSLLAGGCGRQAPGDRTVPKSGLPAVKAAQYTAVTVSTVGGETAPVKGTDGKFHVVYELMLTNTRPAPATLQRIDVLDGAQPSRVIASMAGRELLESLQTLATTPARDLNIEANGGRLSPTSATHREPACKSAGATESGISNGGSRE